MSNVLATLENLHDGIKVKATITGLTGSPTVGFYAVRTPEDYLTTATTDNGGPAPFQVSGQDFIVRMPDTYRVDGLMSSRLFWVWATVDGVATNMLPIWVGVLDIDENNEIINILVGRIRSNAPAIDLRLQHYYDNLALKQVINGRFPQLQQYACIEVHAQSITGTYYAMPMIRRYEVNTEISGFIPSPTDKGMDEVSNAFGKAVQSILNQPGYESMELASGIRLNGCQAQSLVMDYTQESSAWFASWRLSWRGEYSGNI